MADTLKELGRTIGKDQRTVEFVKKRAGYLPQVERTRGIVSTTSSFISPFAANEADRKLSMSLNFYEKVGGGGCEFGEIEEYVYCELLWGVPYPYGTDMGQATLWYGTDGYPPDGFNYPGGLANTQGPQEPLVNTGEFSLINGALHTTRPGFYMIEHHIGPTGVTVSAGGAYTNTIKVNGVTKSQIVYSVANGHMGGVLSAANVNQITYPACPTCTDVRAVVEITSASDAISFHLTTVGVAFFTQPNFAGVPPHTFIKLIGEPT